MPGRCAAVSHVFRVVLFGTWCSGLIKAFSIINTSHQAMPSSSTAALLCAVSLLALLLLPPHASALNPCQFCGCCRSPTLSAAPPHLPPTDCNIFSLIFALSRNVPPASAPTAANAPVNQTALPSAKTATSDPYSSSSSSSSSSLTAVPSLRCQYCKFCR